MIFIWRKKEISLINISLKKRNNNRIIITWETWVWKTSLLEFLRKTNKLDSSVDDVKFKDTFESNNFLWKNKIIVISSQEFSKFLDSDNWFFKEFVVIKLWPINDIKFILKEVNLLKDKIEKEYDCKFWEKVFDELLDLSWQYTWWKFLLWRFFDLIDTFTSFEDIKEKKILELEDIEWKFELVFWSDSIKNIKDWSVDNLLKLSENLSKMVIWHKEAIDKVADTITIAKTGLSDKDKPVWSFLFLWPTWVWKTELAKWIAASLFWNKKNMMRFDMSEYSTPESVYKLVWAPAWQVWYEHWWLLTNSIQNSPSSVILFDEIEKAHKNVLDLFLQLLDEWNLTDNKWISYSFKNSIIIMTSNIWSIIFRKKIELPAQYTWEMWKKKVEMETRTELEKNFRPEFINRFDNLIFFDNLTQSEVFEIIKLKLEASKEIFKHKWIWIEFRDEFIKRIEKEWFDQANWARPVNRAITKELLSPMSKMILTWKVKSWESYIIWFDESQNKILIETKL